MAKIYSSGNYVIVDDGVKVYEYAKGHTLYTLVDDVFYIKEITQGQFKVSVADLNAGNITSDDSGYIYNVGTFTTFLRDNTGFKTAPGGSGAEWGDITGTLSTQTDLQNALDAKQDDLISGTNIKTINGNSVLGSGDLVVGGSSGRFGIADSNGAYTYYTNLTLAMNAATSGQTIEMFADVTETGAVEITLKNGVNINGNGRTYTLNNSGNIQAFKTANSVSIECSIFNLRVVRTGSTATQTLNNALLIGSSTSGNIYLDGSKFINTGSGSGIAISGSSTINIYNANANANTNFGSIYIESNAGAKLINCTGVSNTGIGINCYIGGELYRCYGQSNSNVGIDGAGATNAGSLYDCTAYSVSGAAMTTGLRTINSTGISVSGNGINASQRIYNCVGISTSGRGISCTTGILHNCTAISSSNVGVLLQLTGATMHNCTVQSESSYSVWGWSGSLAYNSTIICNWNNAGGHGIQGISGFITSTIVNCTFRLANASAPYLFNGGTAQAISMRGNTYQGGAAFNANLTQAILTTEDNQGNIFL